MMQIIKHRVNKIQELKLTDKKYGVEIDIRSQDKQLILAHDPFSDHSDKFTDWLDHYDHKLLILNVKEEGLEYQILNQLKIKGIHNYFFLDQSFPFLVKSLIKGIQRVALRFSDLESEQTILKVIQNKDLTPKWVWCDDFHGNWRQLKEIEKLRTQGLQLCLVSPELHGRDKEIEIVELEKYIKLNYFDAVCTKDAEFWEKYG